MRVDITKKQYPKRIGLQDIHVTFPRGCTSLIIGTSGAGKSTLIKCMIGATSFEGEITDYNREDIAYIPQHPALNKLETARNAVYWSALFSRLYHGRAEIDRVVEQHLTDMGLQSVKDSEIQRLSGGQMQRVSIAKELIRGKNIIIADEIDTGLDCGVSRDLVKKLCNITRQRNKTTIIISHNIVNIELYDRVIVLAKETPVKGRKTMDAPGRIAYAGSPAGIREFFGVKDYVDILTKINARDEGGEGLANDYIDKFAAWQSGQKYPGASGTPGAAQYPYYGYSQSTPPGRNSGLPYPQYQRKPGQPETPQYRQPSGQPEQRRKRQN